MTRAIQVPVRCEHRWPDGQRCMWSEPTAHVHQPLPCEYGQPDRHHAFLPPKSVVLDIAGQARRVRLVRP